MDLHVHALWHGTLYMWHMMCTYQSSWYGEFVAILWENEMNKAYRDFWTRNGTFSKTSGLQPRVLHWIFLTHYKNNRGLLTYSMDHSPSWEANQFSVSQEIPCILWNLNAHYHIYKSPQPVPLLTSIQCMPPSNFLKIHFNIILSYMPGSSKWSLSLRFPHQNPVYNSPLPHISHMSRPSLSF